MEPIDINVKIERNEWIKLNFIIGYSNPIMIFITLIGIWMVYTVIRYIPSESYEEDSFRLYFLLLFGILILIGLPISTLIQANKNINHNKWISQKLKYTFSSFDIEIKGETFDLKMLWTDVQSIKEYKNWYAILTDRQRGFFIPKNRFNSKVEELNFKEMLRSLKGVTIKLK